MKLIKSITYGFLTVLLNTMISYSHAAVIDFDGGDFFDGTTLNAVGQIPTAVFAPNQYYLEEGVRYSAIAFNPPTGTSHIHGNFFQGSSRSELGGDAGGAFFVSDTAGQFFSFNSWGQQFFNERVTVQGQDATGTFSVILDPSDFVFDINNTIQTVDFLSLNSRFSNVNLVEYWFTDAGRGVLPTLPSSVSFVDNVNITAVPLPPAIVFFASGFLTFLMRKITT